MTDKPNARTLARNGFEKWQAGQLEEARAAYAEAISLATPDLCGLSDYHGEYACVLSELGCAEEAQEQLEKALEVEIQQSGDSTSVGAIVARYFLADHHVRNGNAEEALATLEPYIFTGARGEWTLRLIEAEALAHMGRLDDASKSAILGLKLAPTDEKRRQLTERFLELGVTV